MNLKKFANVDSCYRDLDTGEEVKWNDYMARVIEKLGIENIAPYIPYRLDFLEEKMKEDIHFNNTSLANWDRAAGFIVRGAQCIPMYDGITHLFRRNGITSYSCSDGVCVLKEAARMLCKKEVLNEQKRNNS